MKKTLLALTVAGISFMGMMNANAADGTVHFTGQLTDTACTVDAGSLNQSVALGTVATSALATKGDKADPTKFQIKLTNCPAAENVTVKFDGSADSTDNTLLAIDSSASGAATNVGIEIADSTGTPIGLATNSPAYAVTTAGGTLDFQARYVATGVSTAGAANADSQFTIVYP